jgi:general secretion pathway protein K
VVVLWVLVLLSITVGIYAILARTESLQARFLFDETAARYAAEAGIHRAVFEMRSTDWETRWVPDGRPYQMPFGEAEVEIRITDESGKINLNAADAELLTDFFISRGVDELEALHLADAILDWRDPTTCPGCMVPRSTITWRQAILTVRPTRISGRSMSCSRSSA